MDGQNFENENNVTVDTTATEVSSAAETVQETPGNRTACEQLSGLYRKCTASGSCNSSCTAAGEQRNQCTGYCQPGTGYPFHRTWMLHRMDRRTVWNRWYHLRSICQQAGQDRHGKGWTDLFYHWYCTGTYHYNLSCCIFCSIYE